LGSKGMPAMKAQYVSQTRKEVVLQKPCCTKLR